MKRHFIPRFPRLALEEKKEKREWIPPSPPLRSRPRRTFILLLVGTAAQESPHHRLRALYSSGSLASPGQSFQFKVKHYGLNCIMVSFPTKKKVGTESNSNEGRLLVSKTQSRRLTSDPAARPGAHAYIYTYIYIYVYRRVHAYTCTYTSDSFNSSPRLATMDFTWSARVCMYRGGMYEWILLHHAHRRRGVREINHENLSGSALPTCEHFVKPSRGSRRLTTVGRGAWSREMSPPSDGVVNLAKIPDF